MANLFKSANKNPNKKRDINIVIKTTTVVLSVLAFFIITAKTTLAEPVIQQWVQLYQNPAYYVGPSSIAVDNQGNSFVTGTNGDTISTTISYDPNGNVRWQIYAGQQYPKSTIDSEGNVYVTGLHWAGYGSGYNWLTIKYNGTTGDQIWYQDYDLPGTGAVITEVIKIDANDNIYITGKATTQPNSYTLKYSPDGEVLWGSNQYCEAVDMDFDLENNVYVTGNTPGTSVLDYCTIKFSSQGDLLWQRTYNGPGNTWDGANSIAVDSIGNAYVTGALGMHMYGYDASFDIGTIKYDTNGNLLWMRNYGQSEIDTNEQGIAIEVDLFGNIVVAGKTTTTGAPSYNMVWTTIKYNPSGHVIWLDNLAGPILTEYQSPNDMTLDNEGNIYITGSFYNPSYQSDAVTIKYNINGRLLWNMRYDSNYDDGGAAIAVDENKNVYVTGVSGNIGRTDYVTIKYVPSINVIAIPENPPIIIPQSGGMFDYNVAITNIGTENQNFDIWTEITSAAGILVLTEGPMNLNMPGQTTINRTRTQTIPANLPIGIYTFTVKAGNYLEDIWSSDSFTFEIQ